MKLPLVFYALACFLPWTILTGTPEIDAMDSVLLPAVGIPLDLTRRDIKNGWDSMERTLPFSPRQIVGSKYAISALSLLWGFGFYWLGQLAFCRETFSAPNYWEDAAYSIAILLLLDTIFLLTLHASVGDVGIDWGTFRLVILLALGVLFVSSYGGFLLDLIIKLLLVSPLLWLLSIPLSVRIYKRKRSLL
ncbi:MAG: ABC-2 transporter permease [Ruminiclostridium sp.]|nr:ABC-2 transporter permease [Ruminiclostridium sp.]